MVGILNHAEKKYFETFSVKCIHDSVASKLKKNNSKSISPKLIKNEKVASIIFTHAKSTRT